jgi:hypothetical protein
MRGAFVRSPAAPARSSYPGGGLNWVKTIAPTSSGYGSSWFKPTMLPELDDTLLELLDLL